MPELPEGYQRLDDTERRAVAGARLVGPADQAEARNAAVGAPELHRRPGLGCLHGLGQRQRA